MTRAVQTALAGAKGVLQVKKTVLQTRIAASTYTKTAYMSLSITPTSTSSLIIIDISLCLGRTNDFGLYLTRNGTYIQNTGFSGGYSRPECFVTTDENTYLGTYGVVQNNYTLYDTPNSTGECTYEFGTWPIGSNTAEIYINRDSAGSGAGTSTITLLEIAG